MQHVVCSMQHVQNHKYTFKGVCNENNMEVGIVLVVLAATSVASVVQTRVDYNYSTTGVGTGSGGGQQLLTSEVSMFCLQ